MTRPRPRRVLLVEDDETTRELVAMALRAQGHEVETVETAEQALEALEEHRPDILFVDIGLPGMSGLDLVRLVRDRPSYEGLPVVVHSAYASKTEEERAGAAGCDRFIAKPATIAQILTALDDLT